MTAVDLLDEPTPEQRRREAVRSMESGYPAPEDFTGDGPDGRDAYLGIADERSAPDYRDEDFDPAYLEAARRYALLHGLPYPISDVDLAMEHVRLAERRESR